MFQNFLFCTRVILFSRVCRELALTATDLWSNLSHFLDVCNVMFHDPVEKGSKTTEENKGWRAYFVCDTDAAWWPVCTCTWDLHKTWWFQVCLHSQLSLLLVAKQILLCLEILNLSSNCFTWQIHSLSPCWAPSVGGGIFFENAPSRTRRQCHTPVCTMFDPSRPLRPCPYCLYTCRKAWFVRASAQAAHSECSSVTFQLCCSCSEYLIWRQK